MQIPHTLPAHAAAYGQRAGQDQPPQTAASGTPNAAGANPPYAWGLNRRQALADAFDALVYRMNEVRGTAQQEAAALGFDGDGDEAAAAAGFEQLEFAFAAEMAVEEQVFFQERTTAVAQGLEGAQRTRYIEASQQVSARVEVSFSLSGTALRGFGKGGKAVAGDSADMNRFLDMVDKLLGQTEAAFEEAFGMVEGFFDTAESGGPAFERFTEDLAQAFFGGQGKAKGNQGDAVLAEAYESIQMEFSFTFEAQFSGRVTMTEAEVQQSDPIVLDLDGDGIELSHYSQGARFDILGTGKTVQTAFVQGGDAFLAIDRNGNGTIDSGRELFGDQRGAVNGYEELRAFDSNGDNTIDAQDTDFDKLLLFRDDGDGRTEQGELLSLAEAGVSAISLGYRNVDQLTSGANRLAQVASFTFTDGRRGQAADAILNFTA